MNRTQLAHVLRSASRIASDSDVLVVGSQAILAMRDEDELPAAATASMEADTAFLDDVDRAKADEFEGRIGEFSPFHEEFGYYAEGIHIDMVVLLKGGRGGSSDQTCPVQNSPQPPSSIPTTCSPPSWPPAVPKTWLSCWRSSKLAWSTWTFCSVRRRPPSSVQDLVVPLP